MTKTLSQNVGVSRSSLLIVRKAPVVGRLDGVQDGRLADEYSRPNLPTERRLKDGIKTRVVSVFASSFRRSCRGGVPEIRL